MPSNRVIPAAVAGLRAAAGAGAGAGAVPIADVLGPFHANQLHAAEQAVTHFRAHAVHHVILWADVQSGKTGTYNAVIRQMMLEGLVDRAYILCGSSETTLRRQATDDAAHYNPDFVARDTLSVLFRQDFKCGRLLTDAGRVLLVVDESHMDQGNGMQLDVFLHKHGIRMSGTTDFLLENQLYILSVSATPYAEVAAVAHSFSYPKEVVRLVPGPGYYGPISYLDNDKLHSTFDIRTRPDEFLALLRAPSNRNKYALVRVNDKPTYDCVVALAHRNRIPLRVYNGRHQTIAITATEAAELNAKRADRRRIASLEDAPPTTTLVLLKQRLRAGKVVPKQQIGFVWEDASMAKTDALIQGLFGRMCGYDVPAEAPSIYLPPSCLKVHADRVVKFSEIQRHTLGLVPTTKGPLILPKRGGYLGGSRSSKRPENGRVQCPALHLRGVLPVADRVYGAKTGPALKRFLLSYLYDEGRFGPLRAHAGLTSDQCTELCELLEGYRTINFNPSGSGDALPPVHIRKGRVLPPGGSSSYSHASYFKSLTAAAAAGTIPEENIDGCHPFNFFAVFNDYDTVDTPAAPGDVYVIFYTTAKTMLQTRPLTHRIPKPLPCAFTIHNEAIGKTAVATTAITLRDNIRSMPAALAGQLQYVLRLWRKFKDGDAMAPMMDNCITSYRGRMWFECAAYGSTNWEDGMFAALLDTLATRYRCRFTVKGLVVYPAVFCVESISWEAV